MLTPIAARGGMRLRSPSDVLGGSGESFSSDLEHHSGAAVEDPSGKQLVQGLEGTSTWEAQVDDAPATSAVRRGCVPGTMG